MSDVGKRKEGKEGGGRERGGGEGGRIQRRKEFNDHNDTFIDAVGGKLPYRLQDLQLL